MTRNHIRPYILVNVGSRRNRQVNQLVQGIDLSLNAATVSKIDHRKAGGVHHVSGNDDVGAAEQYESVGIAVGCGLVQNFDPLVVHAQRLALLEKSLCGPSITGIRRFSVTSAHPVQDALMRENRRSASV